MQRPGNRRSEQLHMLLNRSSTRGMGRQIEVAEENSERANVPPKQAAASVPAGWFPDPDDPKQQRFWDGANWSDQIAPLPPQPVAPSHARAESANWGRVVALLACVGLVIGAWAPWATTALESAPGTDGDGRYTGILGLVLGLFLLVWTPKRIWPLTAAIVVGVIAVFVLVGDVSNVNSHKTYFFGREADLVSVGWGLWLSAISALALVVGCGRYRQEERVRLSLLPADGPSDSELASP